MKTIFVSKFIACLVLLVLLTGTFPSAHAIEYEQKYQLNIGLILFPPFINKENGAQCYGQAISTMHAIFKDSPFTLNIYCASASRIYRDFNSGIVDITLNVKTTPSLSSNVIFSKDPFVELEIVLYTLLEKKPRLISVVRSFDYHGTKETLRLQGLEFIESSTPNEAIVVFLRGGSDSLLSYKKPMEHYIQNLKSGNSSKLVQQEYTQKTLNKVNTYYAVRESHPNATQILNFIEKYYEQERLARLKD